MKKLSQLFAFLFLALTVYAQKPELVIPKGHEGVITTFAISPNGTKIISGSWDMTIKLWDIRTGKEIKTFHGHTGFIRSLVFSKDGKNILSGSNDKTLILWDVQSGKKLKIFKGHEQSVLSCLFSMDESKLISASANSVRIWDVETGREINSESWDYSYFPLDFSDDGKIFVSASEIDDKVILRSVDNGEKIKEFSNGHSGIGSAELAFSPDGNKFASSSNRDVKIWDIETGNVICSLIGHTDRISSIAFSTDATKIATSSADKTIRLWDLSGNEIGRIQTNYIYGGSKILFASNNDKLITAGVSKSVSIDIWDIKTKMLEKTLKGLVSSFMIEPINSNIYLSDDNSNLKNISMSDGKVNSYCPKIHTGVFIQDKYLRSEKNDSIFIYDIFSNEIISSYKFRDGITCRFSNDYLKTVTFKNSEFVIYETISGKEIGRYESNFDVIYNLIPSPGLEYIAVSSSKDNKFEIWDIRKRKLIRSYEGNHRFLVSYLAFSYDCEYILAGDVIEATKIWETGKKKNIKTINKGSVAACFSKNGKYLLHTYRDDSFDMQSSLYDVETWKQLKKFPDTSPIMNIHNKGGSIIYNTFSSNNKYLYLNQGNSFLIWDIENNKEAKRLKNINPYEIKLSKDGKYLFVVASGYMKLLDAKTFEEKLTYYNFDEKDWVVATPEGRFDASTGAMDALYFVKGLNVIPLENLMEGFYTPNLWQRVLEGEKFEELKIKIEDLKLPPLVEITSPENNSNANGKDITVQVKVTDQGSGIDEILLYLNGKVVNTTQRGFKPIEQDNESKIKTFNISLINGKNIIKATAFNNQRTESIPDEITVLYDGKAKLANLNMLVIGIDKYKNESYNLNYAVSDATAFKNEIEKGSKEIFNQVNISFIKDEAVSREKILEELNKIKANASQEDVFVFYYAGHGVMSMEDQSQFYIIPYDVTTLYGDNEILQNRAISANELRQFSIELKAQKQMYVIDACQSGGMTDLLASRGAAKEKAMAQLARSTGTYWLSASGTDQFATEFKELGHGLFTYSILLGLEGQADGGEKDKKITVKELSSFLDDKVPELSEKHKGTSQYPSLYGFGMDFPIVIIK